jgi:chromosome segregation ATPase
VSAQIKEMDDEIIQLQRDILDQDATNKELRQKIDHLEKVIEDLIDRIAKAEDKATQEDKTTQRATRSTSSQQHDQIEATLKAMEQQTKKLDKHVEEVESIVEQLNDTSTQPASK